LETPESEQLLWIPQKDLSEDRKSMIPELQSVSPSDHRPSVGL
jgi:hypothetical protein